MEILMKIKNPIFIIIVFSYGIGAQFPLPNNSINPQSTNSNKLKIHHKEIILKNDYNKPRLKWDFKNTIGTTLMISGSILAYYWQEKAADNYAKYLVSGNIAEMNNYYSKSKKFDRYSRLSCIGIEVGFALNVWSLMKDN